MWGTPRDLELIEQMRQDFNEFRSFIHEHKMIVAEGFIRGNGKKECSDFKGLPLLETKTFQPYFIEANDLPITDFSGFVRTAESAREIFKNATFVSEALPYDAVFSASFIGVHGDVRLLKYLSVIIGSKVFSYYHILTSGKWLVERDELEASDILQMPIPEPATSELSEACKLFDALVESPENNRDAEEFVRRIYGMNESERYHVDDVIDYVYDYFKKKKKSICFERPSNEQYILYYNATREILTSVYGKEYGFNGVLYKGNSPLSVLAMRLESNYLDALEIKENFWEVDEILHKLESSLVDENQMIYIRRNLRIYQGKTLYIIKPAQRQYWTYSIACKDADAIFKDIACAGR